jgi:tetratricopeptide (TPR) repeat protein
VNRIAFLVIIVILNALGCATSEKNVRGSDESTNLFSGKSILLTGDEKPADLEETDTFQARIDGMKGIKQKRLDDNLSSHEAPLGKSVDLPEGETKGFSEEMTRRKTDSSAIKSFELERKGDFLLSEGNLAVAFVEYEKSLQLNPENSRVHYKKALTLLLGGVYEEALKEFREVLRKEPGNALAYKGLGQVFFETRRYDDAEKNFLKAIELDPRLWEAHNFLGMIYDHQKRFFKAICEYSSAIRLRPDEGLLYNNIGVSYTMAGEYQKAINALNKALEKHAPKNRTYNNLGIAFSKLGRYSEAMEAFKNAGNEAWAYNNLGCIYMEAGEYEKAINCFEKAIGISPTFYVKASANLKRARMSCTLNK